MKIDLIQINYIINEKIKELTSKLEYRSISSEKWNFLDGQAHALLRLKEELNSLNKTNCKCGFEIGNRLACICDD